MASPHRERASTASPASHTPRSDYFLSKRSHNSPYRHSPRRSEILADEFSTLHIQEERAWRQRQDERDAEQERLHQQALAQAAAEHERILRNAIEAAETEALKLERERKQKEEEEHRALEAERSAKAAREAAERQRRKDELDRQEQEQLKRAAEERELQERQTRLAEQRQKDEAEALRRKQEKESSDRKAREEVDAAAAAAAAASAVAGTAAATKAVAQPAQIPSAPTLNGQSQAQPPQAQPIQNPAAQPSIASVTQPVTQSSTQMVSTTPSTATATANASPLKSTPAQLEARHKQYLIIHKRLKEVRRNTVQQCKKTPSYGITDIGDYRRKLNMLMGQFTVDKVNNRALIKKILELLVKIRQYTEPSIDITPLLAIPPDNVERRMPAPFVYLLNLIAKNALNQFCSDNGVVADAVAILVATVFSKTEFLFNNTTSLLDILLAKYHMVCPVLFGIYGDEQSDQGKFRLGWQVADGRFVDIEHHKVRMTGLAIGYGCLSLRDFSKSKMQNPFPPTNYWRALSYFANTPPAHLQPTHFIVLKALVETHVEKFLKYYGHAGVVALRRVLVELPKQAPKSAAMETVAVLPRTLQARLHLTL